MIITLKGIVSVISSDPLCKDDNLPDLQRYPRKLSLIKHVLDINVCVSLNALFLFANSLRK